MGLGGRVLRVGALSVLLVLVAFGGWFAWQVRHPPPERFCYGMAILVVDGRDVVLQDSGPPGADPCDGGETQRSSLVLGLDCKVREPDGETIVELEPNRSDGTCGQFEPGGTYPDPWPHR